MIGLLLKAEWYTTESLRTPVTLQVEKTTSREQEMGTAMYAATGLQVQREKVE